MTDLAPLRARIAELVLLGPIKARRAYVILCAEGWKPGQIEMARRRVVKVKGRTKAAWWSGLKVKRAPRPMGLRVRRPDGRFAAPFTAPLVFEQPTQPHAGRCPHGFTVTTQLHGTFACALCEEAAA